MNVKVKRRKQKVVISLEERQLVLNSEVVNNYPFLDNLLKKYDRIYQSDFVDTSDFNKEARTFILYSFKKVVDEASKEWFASYSEAEEIVEDKMYWKHCSLCNAPNKYIFYIHNRLNGIELNVGSECITKFPLINEINGNSIEGLKRNRIKQYNLITRINKFNESYPGAETMIRQWREDYNNLPFVMPIGIHERAENIFKNADLIYKDYISGKSNDQSISLFSNVIDDYKTLKSDIDRHIKINASEGFVCTLQIKDWLLKNKRNSVLLEIMQDGGILSQKTISAIYFNEFVMKYLQDFKNILSDSEIQIDSIRDNKILFKYSTNSKDIIYFECSLKSFMSQFGGYIISNNNFKIPQSQLTPIVNILWDEKNINSIFDKLNLSLNKTNYSLQYDFDKNEVEYVNKGTKCFAVGKASVFLNAHKALLFKYNQSICALLENLFENHISSWKPLVDKEKYDIGNISRNPYSRPNGTDSYKAKEEVATASMQLHKVENHHLNKADAGLSNNIAKEYYLISKITTECPYDNIILDEITAGIAVYKDREKKEIDYYLSTKMLYCNKCFRYYLNQTILDIIEKKVRVKKLKRAKFGKISN